MNKHPDSEISVIIPVFNEEGNISKVIAGVRKVLPGAEIVVVDDGSTDSSSQIAAKAGATVLTHPFNLGYGAALQTGYKYALGKGCSYIVQLDGDGQHDPADIPKLLQVLNRGEADVAIGSRFLGGKRYEVPFPRRAGMKLFNLLASYLTGEKVTDSTSGYQALNREVCRFYADKRYPVDFPDADCLVMLKHSGFKIKEVPVRMYEKAGKSMHSGLRPLYYIFKMFFSMFLMLLRQEDFVRER